VATTRIVGPLSRAAPHRRSFGGVAGEIGAVTLLLLCLRFAPASANEIPTIGDLKRLNVEDLMNVEVTSVSRHPEKLIEQLRRSKSLPKRTYGVRAPRASLRRCAWRTICRWRRKTHKVRPGAGLSVCAPGSGRRRTIGDRPIADRGTAPAARNHAGRRECGRDLKRRVSSF
jgi:hypothetical protein